MTSRTPESFIWIKYTKIAFLLPKAQVITAGCCTDCTIVQGRLDFGGELLPVIDFDKIVKALFGEEQILGVRTSVILRNEGFFEDGQSLALITSADCKVRQMELGEFRLFSERYADGIKRNGIIACRFDGATLSYLINPIDFLRKAA